VTPTYCLYLITPKGEEEIITGEKDPMRIHRIITGRSFSKRASRFGCSIRITKDNKNLRFDKLERICLNIWFQEKEEENSFPPTKEVRYGLE
jgi:hypothetical protein